MILSEVFDNPKGQRIQQCRTICEVHREIYDLSVVNFQDKPDILQPIIDKLEEVFLMGIKMNKKMVEHGCATMTWEKNAKEFTKMRLLRRDLEEKEREVIACIQRRG